MKNHVLYTQPPANAVFIRNISASNRYQQSGVTTRGSDHPDRQIDEALQSLHERLRYLNLPEATSAAMTEINVYAVQVAFTPDGNYILAMGSVFAIPKEG